MINLIKNKNNIEEILRQMGTEDSLTYRNDDLIGSYVVTTIRKINKDEYTEFEEGQNWSDRDITDRTKNEIISKMWEDRKHINKRIKEVDKDLIQSH